MSIKTLIIIAVKKARDIESLRFGLFHFIPRGQIKSAPSKKGAVYLNNRRFFNWPAVSIGASGKSRYLLTIYFTPSLSKIVYNFYVIVTKN